MLALQDEHRECLYLPAVGGLEAGEERGAPLEPGLTQKAAALARHWETQALQPLRAARRGLKALAPQIQDTTTQSPLRGPRERIQELAAERLLLEALEGVAGEPRTQVRRCSRRPRRRHRTCGEPAPDERLGGPGRGVLDRPGFRR